MGRKSYMTRFARALALVALLGPALTIAAAPASTYAGSVPSRSNACIPNFPIGGTCYYPSQVIEAEKSLRFRPVTPTTVVTLASNLSLYRVIVSFIAGPNQTTLSGGRITYVYGRIPAHIFDIRLTPRQNPKFVIVEEALGQDNFGKQVNLTRAYTAKWHTHGPWWFVAVGPIPNVALQVLSNLDKRQVQQIGGQLVAAGSQLNKGVAQKPWNIKQVLSVQGVANLCSHHTASRFTASVRGYLVGMPLQGPGGGWVGRLFTAPNPHAFHAGDTRPFVQVWGTKAWSLILSNQQVTFHGILACDTSTYALSLPGWLGSIKPDRYTTG